jgi:hypothetical protein
MFPPENKNEDIGAILYVKSALEIVEQWPGFSSQQG